MSAILYPVAANADAALAKPKGRAAREREAASIGGGLVRFVTEPAGPAFASREAALDAYAGRLDDPARGVSIASEDRYCSLAERLEGAPPPEPVEPAFARGRRWPKRSAVRSPTVVRLMVSYWRLSDAGAEAQAELAAEQARALRRRAEAAELDASQLRALAQQPLRPVKPQQPLDAGLFEMPAPEAPHILIPDE
jgi:hypothetical protein